jgi:FkbH-like protein
MNGESELDYYKLLKLSKKSKKEEGERVKIAILSDGATQQIESAIIGLFFFHNMLAEVYAPPIDTIDSEIRDKDSEIYQSDCVFIFYTTLCLRDKYNRNLDKREQFLENSLRMLSDNLKILLENFKGQVIHSNFSSAYERAIGNLEYKSAYSLKSITHNLNTHIHNLIRDNDGVLLNDIDNASSYHGIKNWYDDRLWTFSKTPASLDFIPCISKNLYSLYRASKGSIIKCVILDLDNTIWGGVIGDDGLEGIGLGHLDDGESFIRFQSFIKELKNRGMILAVCSKNTKEIALSVFREHPDMVLKEEDIAVFVANWNNKADNIKHIQKILNIGFDSMVFIDDNSFERNLVREFVPDIHVPEVPEEPAEYVKYLCELNLFEVISWSSEDKDRVKMYRDQATRDEYEATIDNKEDYLKSLNMQAEMKRFDKFHLPRIAQLIQRSNQFNLRTSRFGQNECQKFMESKESFPFYIKLEDKFGEYGLISVVILKENEDSLEILEWIMSCRVLKRDVENIAMNFVVKEARSRKKAMVIGSYIETPKNALVKDFYRDFGFKQTKKKEEEGSNTYWEILVDDYEDRTHCIDILT